MPEIHETAYPRLNSSVSDKDLKEVYTPSAAEIDRASEVARGRNAKLYFLVLRVLARLLRKCTLSRFRVQSPQLDEKTRRKEGVTK